MSPDALGEAWRDGRLHGTLTVELNRRRLGRTRADVHMTFDVGGPIAHAPLTRALSARTIIGSGAVSNRGPDSRPDRPIAAGGDSCIAEQRTAEMNTAGAPFTPFLKRGDRVRIWTADSDARPCFGAIDQVVGGAA